jgi:hypothetical protein
VSERVEITETVEVDGEKYTSADAFFAAIRGAAWASSEDESDGRTLMGKEFEIETAGLRLVVAAEDGSGDVLEVVDWMHGETRYWMRDEQMWLVFAEERCRARGYKTALTVTYRRWTPFHWLARLWIWAIRSMMREKTKDEMFEVGKV